MTHFSAEERTRGVWRARRDRGFTLIELMVTIAIVAILAAMAAPSFNSAILSNKLASFANSFVASVQVARSEAIKRNGFVRVCRSADGASCAGSGTWQQGWIVFRDVNNNSTVDAEDTVLQVQQAISADYHFTGNTYSITFRGTGEIIGGAATLVLCRATPSPGAQERELKVSPTGRTSVEKKTTGACA